MLKEALEFLFNQARPVIVQDVFGNEHSTVPLYPIKAQADVIELEVNTLTGLIDYIKSKFDFNFDEEIKLLIHVKSPTEVLLYDALDSTNNRRCYVKAKALLPNITFGRFMDREAFQIMLQANFVDNDDKQTVLNIISNIVEENGVEIRDNGLAQQVKVKQGVATVGLREVPGRVTLKPFRTFIEVAQPESEFILRLREGAQVGLFEADGGAWELNAIYAIKAYLDEHLEDEVDAGQVFIIG